MTPQRILHPHLTATARRARACPVVLAPQDSSTLDLTGKKVAAALGPLEVASRRGVWLHPTLAVTPERVCLGVVDIEMTVRAEVEEGRDHKQVPFTHKESARWLRGYEAACKLQAACPDTQVISIADREGDIYEVLQAACASAAGPRAGYIVRAAQNRRCTDADAQRGTLWNAAEQLPVYGEIDYTLANTETRARRRVKQRLQGGTLTLQPPHRTAVADEQELLPVALTVVLVRELEPPAGEEPLEWLLLSSLPVGTGDDARRIIEYYLCRWEIELYFKALKSGCQVEK